MSGFVGKNNAKISNRPSGGGNKLQGIPATTDKRASSIRAIQNRAWGENRNLIFNINQLGGVGRHRSQFLSNAGGVQGPNIENPGDGGDDPPNPDLDSAKYAESYNQLAHGNFNLLRTVSKMQGETLEPPGLGLFDAKGTYGAGIQSEGQGYMMMLAALYDDSITFAKLSATVQKGIQIGEFGLFPWTWKNTSGTEYMYGNETHYDTASDGDINIALAYIYAANADWSLSAQYASYATSCIENIRNYDINSSLYLLGDGKSNGIPSGKTGGSYHPDYSDLRAFELFKLYDTSAPANFWQNVIDNTIIMWKAIFYFGWTRGDNRTEYPPSSPDNYDLTPPTHNTKLSNATYTNLGLSPVPLEFSSLVAHRTGNKYDTDCQRMPIRLAYYLNKKDSNVNADVLGIAASIEDAISTSYSNASQKLPSQGISIYTPWSSGGGYIQNFTAAGLFALSSCKHLTRDTVYNSLDSQFGKFNGIDGSVISPDFDKLPTSGYNAAFSLWGLTISDPGPAARGPALLTVINAL